MAAPSKGPRARDRSSHPMTRPRLTAAPLRVMAETHALIHFSADDERDGFRPTWILWAGSKRTRVRDAVFSALRENGWIEESSRRGSWQITDAGRAALT